MRVKCEYCQNYIDDTEEKCPNCGAVNKYFKQGANGIPKTIEELKNWYVEHNLPPEETTRFFIGTNYQEPKAFGIYKDYATGNFVVYKNKSDGSRAIRYEGTDEAYAVNELYLRLKEEIINQKKHNIDYNTYNANKQQYNRKKSSGIGYLIFGICLLIITIGIFKLANSVPKNGYYNYNDNYYYYQSGAWYIYDESDGWEPVYSEPSQLDENFKQYYEESYYKSSYGIDSFASSEYYERGSSSDSSWDSGSSWDSSDSWDSGSTDWDSDW